MARSPRRTAISATMDQWSAVSLPSANAWRTSESARSARPCFTGLAHGTLTVRVASGETQREVSNNRATVLADGVTAGAAKG